MLTQFKSQDYYILYVAAYNLTKMNIYGNVNGV